MAENLNYQLGLLHLINLLINVDGKIDETERLAIINIRNEENINDALYNEFETSLTNLTEQEIYAKAIEHLTACSDEERLAAFVHLYKLAQADSSISNKEVRFLLYGLVLSAGMSEHD